MSEYNQLYVKIFRFLKMFFFYKRAVKIFSFPSLYLICVKSYIKLGYGFRQLFAEHNLGIRPKT